MAWVLGWQLRLGLGAQAQGAADALDVHTDHPRPLLAAGQGSDGHAREVAHGALSAVAQRGRDLCAQLFELVVGQLAEGAAIVLADTLAGGGQLDGAKEEALEDELEHAPVLLALGQGGGERLAKVLLGGPADLVQHGERV